MFHDPYTGRYHTHYRQYDPVHARWLSEDPAGYQDGLNLYAAYMGVNGLDPLGLGKAYDDFKRVMDKEKEKLNRLREDFNDDPGFGKLCNIVWSGGCTLFKGTWYGIPGAYDAARTGVGESDIPTPLKTTIKGITYPSEALTESCFLFSMTAPAAPVISSTTSIPYAGPVIKKGIEGLIFFGAGYKTSEVGHKLFSDEYENDLTARDFVELAGLWYGAGSIFNSYSIAQPLQITE